MENQNERRTDFETTDIKPGGWVAITGASSGIGYELAKIFAEEGYNLLVTAEEPGIFEAADVFRNIGQEVQAFQADLSNYDGVESFYREIKSLGVPLDCIVMNAGVGSGGPFLETDLQKELNLIQLNATSVVHLTKRILPDFVSRGEGKILFTSSIAAETPGPFEAVYSASKAFVQSFAMAIAYEVKEHGITVTALQPGATETNFFARANMLDTKVGQAKKDSAAEVARQGYDAMQAGKDHVVAGSLMNKIQALMSRFISEQQGAAMEARQAKPLSEADKERLQARPDKNLI